MYSVIRHGENSIYLIHQELNAIYKDKIRIIPIIADVQNPERIQDVMNRYKPYAVYHAAAHKHVPLMEYNPIEAFRNNVLGTRNVAIAAKTAGSENSS